MRIYFDDRQDVASYVNDMVTNSDPDSPLTMIITRGKSDRFCVHTATKELSDGYAETVLDRYMNTSLANTRAG